MKDDTTIAMEHLAKRRDELIQRCGDLALECAAATGRLKRAEAELRFAADARTQQGQQLLEHMAHAEALRSQIAVLEQAGVDPEVHEVYRRAAMYLATYVAGARESADLGHRRRVDAMWGSVADEVEAAIARERVH